MLGGSAEGQRALWERPSGGPPGTPESLPSSVPLPWLFPRLCPLPQTLLGLLSRGAEYRCHFLREIFLGPPLQSALLPSLSPHFTFSVPVLLSKLFHLLATSPRQSVGSVTAATSLCANGSDPWWEQGPMATAGALVDVCGAKERLAAEIGLDVHVAGTEKRDSGLWDPPHP